MAKTLLIVFLALKAMQHVVEATLSRINRNYYLDKENQKEAMEKLGISSEDMDKTMRYTEDKFRFAQITNRISLAVVLFFIALGGLGYVDRISLHSAQNWFGDDSSILWGLCFFLLLSLLSMVMSLPFEYYKTFVIEEKHGFNRTNRKTFIMDRFKGLVLMALLGGPIMALILWIMESAGSLWWVWAWFALSTFSIFTAWIYPTFLAPLFNKFSPLPEGELKEQILTLAQKIGFKTSGLSVMDASKRSAHGNAYFTGMFGAKKIVLFDTLVDAMKPSEVVAVLAHELGHFKLNHVRWGIVRSIVFSFITFYLLSLFLPLQDFYTAFAFDSISNHAALTVFTLWFGILNFVLQPLETYISRKNEFAADAFALQNVANGNKELGSALLKLRETSHVMPLTHPIYSAWYHSHPPMLERLKAMKYSKV